MKRGRALTRRQRRLYATLGLIAAAAAAGIFFGVRSNQSNRPTMHRPGEKLEGVTDSLSLGIPEEAPFPRFTDVTNQAGLTFRSFAGDRSSQLPEDMGSGAAWGDYDNDGDDDLFLVSAGGSLRLPESERAGSTLFENRGDGTFRPEADFPDTRIIGMGAAWADYDGDGWLDLAVSGYNSLLLFRNEQGRFERASALPDLPGFWAGVSWGDYDSDGDLDLYVCGYVRYREEDRKSEPASRQYGRDVPFTLNPSSYPPERNLLFRNDGDGSFTETAAALGIDNLKGRSLSALWRDFNDDGLPDLYVANDISDNVLFLNRGGTFEDASHGAWVADYRGAMGLAAGDWNGDGDEDLFVTHWMAQENALYDSLLADLPGPEQKGSAEPSLRFMDVADVRGLGQIALRSVGWGTEFADFDSDGWLDLLVSNGSTLETADDPPLLQRQKFFLFWNRRGESFHNLAPLHDALAGEYVGRGLAVSDYDNDGDLDFVVIHHGEGARLYRNDVEQGNWLALRLRSRAVPADLINGRGEGAKVTVEAGGKRLTRIVGGASYLSQSSLQIHFGLGDTQTVDRLEVRWPGRQTEVYRSLEANRVWVITEGERLSRDNTPPSPRSGIGTGKANEKDRARIAAFWTARRAAMKALKKENDPEKAIALLREALSYDPAHEDSLYYLGQTLAGKGDIDGALQAFGDLVKANPSSHRGHSQTGFLLARTAASVDDLAAAERSLEQALAINPEETGVLLILGEISLIQGRIDKAGQRLAWACRTNPRAAVGFYLQAYLAWKRGDSDGADEFLARARPPATERQKPEGSSSEGDVKVRMHTEETLLSSFYNDWKSGGGEKTRSFTALGKHLDSVKHLRGEAEP